MLEQFHPEWRKMNGTVAQVVISPDSWRSNCATFPVKASHPVQLKMAGSLALCLPQNGTVDG